MRRRPRRRGHDIEVWEKDRLSRYFVASLTPG
jgi:hypothetical protein